MARALVLHLLLAGAAAMPTHGTSEVDDPIAGHLRDRADASDHATSHSHVPRPIDEEVADAHDQHALTPPGNGVRHVHRSARGRDRSVGTPDAAHDRARRASARAARGQTPRHLQLERGGDEPKLRACSQVTITSANFEYYQDCQTMSSLTVRARPRPPPPALG